MKNERQQSILSIINEKKIHTHEQLVAELASLGFRATQATVSRDIKELGLVKIPDEIGSVYSVALEKDNAIHKYADSVASITCAVNLVIVKTKPGIAPAVALAIDKNMSDDILGSIAGDDTIFIAVHNEEIARELTFKFKKVFFKN